jgi:hypothetical protein
MPVQTTLTDTVFLQQAVTAVAERPGLTAVTDCQVFCQLQSALNIPITNHKKYKSTMVKAVQAEDAISDHFDRLLKDRVTAEVCFGVRGRVVVEMPGPQR